MVALYALTPALSLGESRGLQAPLRYIAAPGSSAPCPVWGGGGAADGGYEASEGDGDLLGSIKFPMGASDRLGGGGHAEVDGPACLGGRAKRKTVADDGGRGVDADEVCGDAGVSGNGAGEGAVARGEVGGVHDDRIPHGEPAAHHAVDTGEDGAMLLGAARRVGEDRGADGVETAAEIAGDSGFAGAGEAGEDDEERGDRVRRWGRVRPR